jgi:hypothetical protein
MYGKMVELEHTHLVNFSNVLFVRAHARVWVGGWVGGCRWVCARVRARVRAFFRLCILNIKHLYDRYICVSSFLAYIFQ